MKLLKNFFFILIFLSLSINHLKAENKIFYIDIDYVLMNSAASKELLETLKKEEEIIINKFKSKDENFNNEEKKILAKKNLISKEEINDQLKLLKVKFEKYQTKKIKEVNELKIKRDKNIMNFFNLVNPIIEKYMTDNSIYMLIDKKNVFIARKEYDITINLIELIDNQIKSIKIE